ncbi:hypothetical protein [Roseomonas elaeocarpi]|uniref:SnoaL-like domain-containing protein n=1 Tax=Roseomonas elaeocarpi TaxID=907779 RepID=A0ABV6JQZ9_9PROT
MTEDPWMPTVAGAESVVTEAVAMFDDGSGYVGPGTHVRGAGPLTLILTVEPGGAGSLAILGWRETDRGALTTARLFRAEWESGELCDVTEFIPGTWEAELARAATRS